MYVCINDPYRVQLLARSPSDEVTDSPPALHLWVFPASAPPGPPAGTGPQQAEHSDLGVCAASHREGLSNVDVPSCAFDALAMMHST